MPASTELNRFPILVVDDEPDNLDAFRFNFRRVFKIHTAGSGDEGGLASGRISGFETSIRARTEARSAAAWR